MVYPITIIRARYAGTYEGNPWLAFHAYVVPIGATDSDIECMEWWDKHRDDPDVAGGITPCAALAELERRHMFFRPASEQCPFDQGTTDKVNEIREGT